MANLRIRTAIRLWEEKEGEGGCNQIRRRCHHRDEGGREDLMIATLGMDDTSTHTYWKKAISVSRCRFGVKNIFPPNLHLLILIG